MTKQQELNILGKAIDELGENSYLGPALRHLLPEIENNLRCDIEPDIVSEIRRLENQVDELRGHKDSLEATVRQETEKLRELSRNIGFREEAREKIKKELQAMGHDLLSLSA